MASLSSRGLVGGHRVSRGLERGKPKRVRNREGWGTEDISDKIEIRRSINSQAKHLPPPGVLGEVGSRVGNEGTPKG